MVNRKAYGPPFCASQPKQTDLRTDFAKEQLRFAILPYDDVLPIASAASGFGDIVSATRPDGNQP